MHYSEKMNQDGEEKKRAGTNNWNAMSVQESAVYTRGFFELNMSDLKSKEACGL